MVIVEFARGNLPWYDRLKHAEIREKAANQTSPNSARSLSDVAGGAGDVARADQQEMLHYRLRLRHSCKIAFFRGTHRDTEFLSPSTY